MSGLRQHPPTSGAQPYRATSAAGERTLAAGLREGALQERLRLLGGSNMVALTQNEEGLCEGRLHENEGRPEAGALLAQMQGLSVVQA